MNDIHKKGFVDLLRKELIDAENILDTQYSFELAEPNYIRCLQVISEASDQREQFVKLLICMFMAKEVSDEPIAFLMHVLRWSEIYDWAKNQLYALENPIVNGRPFEKIIAAFDDGWENREIYSSFAIPPIQ